jgi:L-ascorbate metabolism protein UlaG (beta-lactamase superfamily)
LEGVKFYYAGDTDFIEPMKKLKGEKIDVALLPIGGTYTMDIDEAVEATREIEPKMVLPLHYNHIKGTEADPFEFKEKVQKASKAEVRVVL